MRQSPRIVLSFALGLASLVACTPHLSAAALSAPHALPAGAPIDINTATMDQLKSLPGIGDAYAKRIIAGRPYSAKNQLVTRGVLPQPVYDKIAGKIIAQHAGK
jgi:competence protein ComEA